ncbi:MAG TPA: hypothetical protein VJV74_16540, partial [Terriglobia bacterium]|nr:hypothetical protein [Terriglobia bacterium]
YRGLEREELQLRPRPRPFCALIGAIAGHGKGAAIGAAAGAGAGATAQVLTRGKEVHVPAETLLRFRLDTDLNLNPE